MNTILAFIQEKAGIPRWRRGFYLVVLLLIALVSAFVSGQRRTFSFYRLPSHAIAIEDRLVPRRFSTEVALSIYVSEALLGPTSVHSTALFTKGTKLESLISRKGTVFVNLSELAAIPVAGETSVDHSVQVLKQGISRNFPLVKRVVVFINGREIPPTPDRTAEKK